MSVMERARQSAITGSHRALTYLPATLLLLDLLILTATGLLALLGRERLDVFTNTGGVRQHLPLLGLFVVPTWLLAIALAGGYRRRELGVGTEEFKRVFTASVATAGVLGVGCYLIKYDLSRGYFMLCFLIGPVLLLVGRMAMRVAIRRARRRGHLRSRVLVAGTPERIDEVSDLLRRESWLGYGVVGGITLTPSSTAESHTGVPLLGVTTDLVEVSLTHQADVVVVTGGVSGTSEAMKELVWDLEQHKIEVVVAPHLADIAQSRMRMRPVGGAPLIQIDHARWASAGRYGKRIFDVVGSLVFMAVLAPVFGYAALRVKLHDRGPLLFRHYRVGRDGQHFACLKFRTMVVDAEDQVENLQARTGQAALLFKMKDDPRVTRPGRWMRRFSIDELPQLVNVLKGDMSLVGPRPQVQKEVDLYRGAMARRLLVRPGLTGLWQVSGRNDLTPEEAMRLDVYYVDNWSMLQDLMILGSTVRAVFSSRGAY